MFALKEIIINWCANIYSGKTENNLLRIAINLPEFLRNPKEGHITDYNKAESTVRLATQFVIHFVAFHYDMKLIYCGVLFLRRV